MTVVEYKNSNGLFIVLDEKTALNLNPSLPTGERYLFTFKSKRHIPKYIYVVNKEDKNLLEFKGSIGTDFSGKEHIIWR